MDPDGDPDGIAPIPLAEERAEIGIRRVERGKLSIHLATEEVQEVVNATLHGRRASVHRVPIDREVSEAPQVRQEGDVVIVPVLEEVLVVERRLRLVEELHLRLEPFEEEVAVPVSRRRQRAEITRDAPPSPSPDPETSP